MKNLDIFNKRRRRRFTDNQDGIFGLGLGFTLLILIGGGIVLLLVLSQIIVPLIILLVVVMLFSIVLKRVWGIKAPEAIGREITAVGKAVGKVGVPYAKKGASWFEKLIGVK